MTPISRLVCLVLVATAMLSPRQALAQCCATGEAAPLNHQLQMMFPTADANSLARLRIEFAQATKRISK